MPKPKMSDNKIDSNHMLYFSIDQLKSFLKNQIRLKADQGELFISEYITKDFTHHEINNLGEEFKKAGYKVKIRNTGEEKIFSVFWN
ncbi:hypothetical protein [Acinetobacter sp.]|uniref:hypothetical protein n=1 Tax=Acinetobacter sp. TaxID=472 RepID=UPI003AFF9FEC